MNPAYITCIKDEESLIYYNLKYYYNIGLRHFYIMFNNSNDATRNQVARFEKEQSDAEVRYFEDGQIAYLQPDRFNMMSREAHLKGHDWIIPVDADEILKLPPGRTIQDMLAPHSDKEYGFIKMKWIDYQATDLDDLGDVNVFTRWKFRNQDPRPQSKILVKWVDGMKYGDGHHLIISKRKHIGTAKSIFVAHFYGRSRDQIEQKIINIGKAFIERYGLNMDKPQVTNYLRYEKIGGKYIDELWGALCERRQKRLNKYIFDPIDPRLFF